LVTYPSGLIKRTFTDGQYTVIRQFDWLLKIMLEGPLGERSGMALVSWLNDFFDHSDDTCYLLLDATNLSLVAPNVLREMALALYHPKIGGVGIVGESSGQRRLEVLLVITEHSDQVRFFVNPAEAINFLQTLRRGKRTAGSS
jgi:hypothetical protein